MNRGEGESEGEISCINFSSRWKLMVSLTLRPLYFKYQLERETSSRTGRNVATKRGVPYLPKRIPPQYLVISPTHIIFTFKRKIRCQNWEQNSGSNAKQIFFFFVEASENLFTINCIKSAASCLHFYCRCSENLYNKLI